MTEQLETSLHSEVLPNHAHLVQSVNSITDGTSNALGLSYESDNEKPILLELGVNLNNPKTAADISNISYSTHHPLDLQINSAFDAVLPSTPSNIYGIDPIVLFTNPYTSRKPTTLTQISPKTSSQPSSSSTLITLKSVPYPAHIPQTVYSWSTPTPVTSNMPNEANNKLATEIVPPPVLVTYSDAREHTITKQTNHCWKEKVLQNEKDYKKTACDRERTRMRDMNRAFDQLRSKLPISKPNGKKYSKIESLRIAINYINHLQRLLNNNFTDQNFLATEELVVRRRTNLYRFENQKTSSFQKVKQKFQNLDESQSTWSDGYLQNGEDKWD